MHKIFILNLIFLNFFTSLIGMHQIVKKSLFRSFSSSSKKELAYNFFGLKRFDRKYSGGQLNKIYSHCLQLHSKHNPDKLIQIKNLYNLIEQHQNFVTHNKIYPLYTLSDSELTEVLNSIKQEVSKNEN